MSIILPGRIGIDKLLKTSGGKIGICQEESSSSSSSSSSSYSVGNDCQYCSGTEISKYIRLYLTGIEIPTCQLCYNDGYDRLKTNIMSLNGQYILTQKNTNACIWEYIDTTTVNGTISSGCTSPTSPTDSVGFYIKFQLYSTFGWLSITATEVLNAYLIKSSPGCYHNTEEFTGEETYCCSYQSYPNDKYLKIGIWDDGKKYTFYCADGFGVKIVFL